MSTRRDGAAEVVLEDDDAPVEASPFVLSPHQQFIDGSIVGWYTTEGYRRFRDSYIEGAKGDGKTPNGAGLMLYLLVADGERGAQIFFAASGRRARPRSRLPTRSRWSTRPRT